MSNKNWNVYKSSNPMRHSVIICLLVVLRVSLSELLHSNVTIMHINNHKNKYKYLPHFHLLQFKMGKKASITSFKLQFLLLFLIIHFTAQMLKHNWGFFQSNVTILICFYNISKTTVNIIANISHNSFVSMFQIWYFPSVTFSSSTLSVQSIGHPTK